MLTEQHILELMQGLEYKPMTVAELQEYFSLEDGEQLQEFLQLIELMEADGKVYQTRSNTFGVPEKMNLVVGRMQGKSRGFGFVIPEDPEKWQADLFVAANDMHGAMHGDRVIAKIIKKGQGPRIEGEVVRVLERVNKTVVGTVVTMSGRYAFISPDDKRLGQDIFVAEEDFAGAKEGHKVVVEITSYSEGWRNPQGRVLEVLGFVDDPGVDILSVIRKYNLPEEFPEAVLEEANDIPDIITAKDLEGRRDLRDLTIVTIDGEDAKDLDDAVHVIKLDNGNTVLGVHIADVTYYVREGTELDKEAYARATSVYLVDRVVPMLPHRLSNGICSLNPQVDRLTMTCEMEFSPDMKLVRHDIYPSVIKTKERMTYKNVYKILHEDDADLSERYRELVPMFREMEEFAMRLRNRRMERGAIDFDFQETKVIVDRDTGKVTDIVRRERTIAEMIIEEFMLAANETVSAHFHWMNIPFVYRVHEEPKAEKIQAFNEFVHNFGYHLKGQGSQSGEVHPKALQELIEKVKGLPEERIINTVLLRSLKQARYADQPIGHFGLAAQYYSHFTSPIRRYPDLQIHRIMRDVFDAGGQLNSQRIERLQAILPEVCRHTSERERNATDAERETDDLKKCEFMLDKVGEVFDGIISGVTSFGMFVELDNSVEGMVHMSYMDDDYYNFNEKQYCLIGERTGNIYRIGDKVQIKVMNANKQERTIDFVLLQNAKTAEARTGNEGRGGFKGRKPEKGKRPGERSERSATGRPGIAAVAGSGDKKKKKKNGRGPGELQQLKQVVAKSKKNKGKKNAR